MTDQQFVLKIISTLAILLPLFINLLRIKKAGLVGWLFLCFLFMGFFSDVLMWYLYIKSVKGISGPVFTLYSLFEALFFFWVIQYLTESSVLKSIARIFLFAAFPLWIGGFFIYPLFIEGQTAQYIPFSTAYEVITSFLSGFALLYLAEHEKMILRMGSFWFFLALFFYCFCTFFIMSMLGSFLSLSLWPLNNIINIITYIFYSVGLWCYTKSKV